MDEPIPGEFRLSVLGGTVSVFDHAGELRFSARVMPRTGGTSSDEIHKLARLFAASKTMLAALEAVLPSLDSLVSQDCPDPDVNSHDIMTRARVRATIKLARGE